MRVTDEQIKRCVREGKDPTSETYATMGCGSCAYEVYDIINKEQRQMKNEKT